MNLDYKKIFNQARNINDHILNKYNDEQPLSFLDHYLFQSTYFICSLIYPKYYYNDVKFSINNSYIYRCLIENLAVILYYIEGNVPENSVELLECYNYIEEYDIYNRHKKLLDGVIYDFEQIKANYKETKEKYKTIMKNKSTKEVKNIIQNSKIPFVQAIYRFDEIVEEFIPELYHEYKFLSVIIHPHDLIVSKDIKNDDFYENLEVGLLCGFESILEQYFDYENVKEEKTFESEVALLNRNPFNLNYLIRGKAQELAQILKNVSNLITAKMGVNSKALFYLEMSKFIDYQSINHIFSFHEVVKALFKPIIELLALDHYEFKIMITNADVNFSNSICAYTFINFAKANGFPEDSIDNMILEYIKEIGKDITIDEVKEKFKQNLGFLEENKSLNRFVYDYLEETITNKIQCEYMKMVYDEAQAFSHANGYAINSNDEAFCDHTSVIPLMENLIIASLTEYIDLMSIHDDIKNLGYGELIYQLSMQLDRFRIVSKEKNDLALRIRNSGKMINH